MIEQITGAEVKAFRIKHDITRFELAAMLGSNPTTLYFWEHGKALPHLGIQKRFSELRKNYIKTGFTVAEFKKIKKEYKFTNAYFAEMADISCDTVNRFSQGKKVNKFTVKLIEEAVAKIKATADSKFNVANAATIICEKYGREYLMEKFNVTENTIYCWCSGRRQPIFTDVVKLQALFKELFTVEKEK